MNLSHPVRRTLSVRPGSFKKRQKTHCRVRGSRSLAVLRPARTIERDEWHVLGRRDVKPMNVSCRIIQSRVVKQRIECIIRSATALLREASPRKLLVDFVFKKRGWRGRGHQLPIDFARYGFVLEYVAVDEFDFHRARSFIVARSAKFSGRKAFALHGSRDAYDGSERNLSFFRFGFALFLRRLRLRFRRLRVRSGR
jgi:hypothetical protein